MIVPPIYHVLKKFGMIINLKLFATIIILEKDPGKRGGPTVSCQPLEKCMKKH